MHGDARAQHALPGLNTLENYGGKKAAIWRWAFKTRSLFINICTWQLIFLQSKNNGARASSITRRTLTSVGMAQCAKFVFNVLHIRSDLPFVGDLFTAGASRKLDLIGELLF